MKKLYIVKLGLILGLSCLVYNSSFASYVSKPNFNGDYEDASAWDISQWPNRPPSVDGNVSDAALEISTGATIKRNGHFNPVAVSIKGTFIINGNYTNNQWGGVTVEGDGKLEIFGDLTGSAGITVKNGGLLIVHGNLISTGSGITSHGDIVVAGDFSTTSNTTVYNNGNLIVGGDFAHAGGGFSVNGSKKDTKVYILNPDADVSLAPGSVLNNGDLIGDLDDFLVDESSSEIGSIVNDVIVSVIMGSQWKTDNSNNRWTTDTNWTGNRIPTLTSNVRIKASSEGNSQPIITYEDGIIEVMNLIIESGAVLTLKPGAKLTVNGNLTIEEEGGLVMENTTEVNGLSSLITKGDVIGKAQISLVFPRDEWYYVSQPIKEAKSDIYALLNTEGAFRTSEAWVNIHRANRWYRIAGGVAIGELEGLSIKYRVADENDEADHLVTYTGELNNGSVSRTFANAQYYLFGNPYPSSINWQEDAGWSRSNIGGTIYYRARVNGSMAFVTYNRFAAVEAARAAVFPDGVEDGDVAELAIIPPLQSVWVSSLGEGSITIDNNARQHVAAGSLLKSARGSSNSSVIRIGVSNESGADGAVLYFSENSDEGLDLGDSEKMFNDAEGIPEVFTRVGDRSMAINGLPLLENDTSSFSLSVRNKTLGEVNLKFDLSAFASDYVPVLEDKLANVFVDITQTNIYTYSVVEVGTNHDRFVIHLNYQPVVDDQEEIVEDELESEEPEISDDEDVVDAGNGSSTDNEDVTDGENGDDSEALESDGSDADIVDGGNGSSTDNEDVSDGENGDDSEDLESDGSDTDIEEGASEDSDENLATDQSDSQSKEETDNGVSTSIQDQQQDAADAQNAISIKSIAGKVLISVDVEMLQSGPGIVEIYSIEGRKISEVPARSSRTLVFLPSQSGIYIVRAIFGNIVKSERVMVKG